MSMKQLTRSCVGPLQAEWRAIGVQQSRGWVSAVCDKHPSGGPTLFMSLGLAVEGVFLVLLVCLMSVHCASV